MGEMICLLRKPESRGDVGVRGCFFGYSLHFLPYHGDDRGCRQQGKNDHDKERIEQARPDGLSCGSLAQFEGKHKVGLQNAGELPRNHRRISAVWAGRCRSRRVAEQLRTA